MKENQSLPVTSVSFGMCVGGIADHLDVNQRLLGMEVGQYGGAWNGGIGFFTYTYH